MSGFQLEDVVSITTTCSNAERFGHGVLKLDLLLYWPTTATLKKKENDKMKNNVVTKKKKKLTQHMVLVLQGRSPLFGDPIKLKVLYKEVVPDRDTAVKREKELREEYKDVEALSVQFFSL